MTVKSWEKEIYQVQLDNEKFVLARLKTAYKGAIQEAKEKLAYLATKEQTQSVIYQKQYQESLLTQLETVYNKMNKNMYQDIDSYLKDCYEDSFLSTMYGLHKQGIPLIFPIQQEEATRMAGRTGDGIKLSDKLYQNTGKTARTARDVITRGLASGASYADIARNLERASETTLNQAYRIARTEGHRVQNEVNFNTLRKAKDSGADVVKQWDSTLDSRTRPHHAQLDGQIREIDEPFEVAGRSVLYPGGFGVASEDINCRCAVLQRAKWALDKDELQTMKDRAAYYGLDKTKDFKEFKAKYVKANEQQAKIQKLTTNLAKQQQQLNKIDNKTYSGIWKDDVKVSDYKYKKGSIQAKRDYFKDQIAKLTGVDDAKVKTFQKYLDDLDEFEKLGSKYEKISDKIAKIQGDLKKLMPTQKKSAADLFTQERKDAAYWFTNANGSTKAADKVLRDKCGDVWQNASKSERTSIWDYTSGSGSFNRPLSGFQKPYYEGGSGWEPKYYKGINNVWIDYEDSGDAIRKMTDIINKSDYDFDIWLQRGCGTNAIESFLNLPSGSLYKMSETDLQQFVGTNNRIYSFVSTSVSKGNGFTGDVIMNIYAPEGTKMMYAEPFSAFGGGNGLNWDGKSQQSYFGGESEMILQRGASYTITKIEKSHGKIYIDLEVHPEDGYDLIQQDPAEWTGAKDKFK